MQLPEQQQQNAQCSEHFHVNRATPAIAQVLPPAVNRDSNCGWKTRQPFGSESIHDSVSEEEGTKSAANKFTRQQAGKGGVMTSRR